MNWVIATPGRTGSNLIVQHLASMNYKAFERRVMTNNTCLIEAASKIDLIVTHDHGMNSFKPSGDTGLCVILRKDVFKQTCSGLIAVKTKEFNSTQYNGVEEKFSFTVKEFDQILSYALFGGYLQALQIQQERWKKSVIVFYEDLICMGIKEFCKEIGMPYNDTSDWKYQKSQRQAESTIINYNQLLEHYNKNHLEKVSKYLTDIENVRKNS
jgi:hypothetical protein